MPGAINSVDEPRALDAGGLAIVPGRQQGFIARTGGTRQMGAANGCLTRVQRNSQRLGSTSVRFCFFFLFSLGGMPLTCFTGERGKVRDGVEVQHWKNHGSGHGWRNCTPASR